MNIQFKDELLDKMICVPILRTNMVCKFIDIELYPYLFSKYPDLFKIIEDDDNNINDTE